MRMILLLLCFCCGAAWGSEAPALSQAALLDKTRAFIAAESKAFTRGATPADLEAVFAFYTEDFTYVHEAYGGVYTREKLYGNAKRNLEAGRYEKSEAPFRGELGAIIPGLNAVAVQRLKTGGGESQLTVIEFRGEKISRIIEYWR